MNLKDLCHTPRSSPPDLRNVGICILEEPAEERTERMEAGRGEGPRDLERTERTVVSGKIHKFWGRIVSSE